MSEKELIENELLRRLATADSSFTETAVFIAVFMCLFVVGWSVRNLLGDKNSQGHSEPTVEAVDAKLTWAMVFTGFFIMIFAVYVIITGFVM